MSETNGGAKPQPKTKPPAETLKQKLEIRSGKRITKK